MAITLQSNFKTLAKAGVTTFQIQRKIGEADEWTTVVDNTLWLWASLNRITVFSWATPKGPMEETATTKTLRLEVLVSLSTGRYGKTGSGSELGWYVDHAGGQVTIDVLDDTGGSTLDSATDSQTTRGSATGKLDVSSASADEILIRVSLDWDGVTGSEHLLYGVCIQEEKVALADL